MNEDEYCPTCGVSFEHYDCCYRCGLCYDCCLDSVHGCLDEDDYEEVYDASA